LGGVNAGIALVMSTPSRAWRLGQPGGILSGLAGLGAAKRLF